MAGQQVAGVYEIKHVQTDRRYVGSSIDMHVRWREHRCSLRKGRHHSIVLQRAWNKHGESAFAFRPLLICARDDAVYYEQRAFDALKPEFNCAPRAGSQLGYQHRPETIAKMQAAAVGRPSSFRGFRHSDESRKLISESRRGKGGGPRSPERLRKISEALKGRPVPAERRAKISASLTGKKQSAETIAKRVLKIAGRKAGADECRRRSEATKQFYRDNPRYSADVVQQIRSLSRSGMSARSIGRLLGIGRGGVGGVVSGRTHTEVSAHV